MAAEHAEDRPLQATYARARAHVADLQAIVVLHLGDEGSMLAMGTGAVPAQLSALPLGLQGLAHRLLPDGRWREWAIEHAIAEVEDIVMPWHGQRPPSASLFTADAAIAELAHWAGRPDNSAAWWLTTEAVEHLFNRWVALAQGRPASQDDLPATGRFAATLLVLRECLHHLGFEGITVIPGP